MRAAASGVAKPTSSKAYFRDKCYLVPGLLVDLSIQAYATTLWSASQPILRDVHDDLAVDEEFTGILAFEDAPDSGLFQGRLAQGETFAGTIRLEKGQEPGRFAATVIRADTERRSLALKFQDLSTSTFALLEAAMKKTSAE
jgi:hypothetical protein